MDRAFPIVRRPAPTTRTPVLVSVPHYGTRALPHITRDDYSEPWFETFAYGFADTFVGDLYADLHELVATVAAIFTGHGFEVHQNVSGYTGGNIVATYGHPRARRVHALQLEINASLLTTTTGEKAEANIARLRQCLREVLAALPRVLATVHEG